MVVLTEGRGGNPTTTAGVSVVNLQTAALLLWILVTDATMARGPEIALAELQ